MHTQKCQKEHSYLYAHDGAQYLLEFHVVGFFLLPPRCQHKSIGSCPYRARYKFGARRPVIETMLCPAEAIVSRSEFTLTSIQKSEWK